MQSEEGMIDQPRKAPTCSCAGSRIVTENDTIGAKLDSIITELQALNKGLAAHLEAQYRQPVNYIPAYASG